MLMTSAHLEGCRALYTGVALTIDAAGVPDPEVRAAADKRVALLTVIRLSFRYGPGCGGRLATGLGGHGYIREWGMEQYVRDALSPRSTKAQTACKRWTWSGVSCR